MGVMRRASSVKNRQLMVNISRGRIKCVSIINNDSKGKIMVKKICVMMTPYSTRTKEDPRKGKGA